MYGHMKVRIMCLSGSRIWSNFMPSKRFALGKCKNFNMSVTEVSQY